MIDMTGKKFWELTVLGDSGKGEMVIKQYFGKSDVLVEKKSYYHGVC